MGNKNVWQQSATQNSCPAARAEIKASLFLFLVLKNLNSEYVAMKMTKWQISSVRGFYYKEIILGMQFASTADLLARNELLFPGSLADTY